MSYDNLPCEVYLNIISFLEYIDILKFMEADKLFKIIVLNNNYILHYNYKDLLINEEYMKKVNIIECNCNIFKMGNLLPVNRLKKIIVDIKNKNNINKLFKKLNRIIDNETVIETSYFHEIFDNRNKLIFKPALSFNKRKILINNINSLIIKNYNSKNLKFEIRDIEYLCVRNCLCYRSFKLERINNLKFFKCNIFKNYKLTQLNLLNLVLENTQIVDVNRFLGDTLNINNLKMINLKFDIYKSIKQQNIKNIEVIIIGDEEILKKINDIKNINFKIFLNESDICKYLYYKNNSSYFNNSKKIKLILSNKI